MTQPTTKRLVTEQRLSDAVAAAVAAPADPAIASAVTTSGSQTQAALDGRYRKKSDLVLSVKDYGAKGDGTTDDTAAINAALAAAATGSRQVYIPGGTYKLTGTLTIPTGCELVGESAKSAILQSTTDRVSITMTGGEAQGLRRFKLANSFTGVRTTYDIEIINPFKPVLDQIEVALSQSATAMGGIHIYKVAGQPGDTNCFMPELLSVWVRNGLIAIEDVTDGKMTGGFVWGTYTGAAGAVQVTRSSNWTFNNVDVVPPQGDAGGYLVTDLNNLSIIGGLMDGSYDTIMTGHGIKTAGFTRGLSVMGVKFFNLGRSGLKLNNVRRSSFVGNVFVQNNKLDASYADVDITACASNTFIGNTHGAPNVRTNLAKCYVEDSTSSDNSVRSPSIEVNSSIVPNGHYYATPLVTLQDTTNIQGGVPAVNWPSLFALASKGTNYTVTKPDLFENRTILATASGITITLPSAGSIHAADRVTIKNGSTGTVNIATTSSQTIDGAAAPLTLSPGQSVTVMSDGAAWQVVASRASAPVVAVPYLSTLATISATVWPTANLAIFQRFHIPESRTYRYVNLRLDTSSGNWQVAVVRLSGAGRTTYARVMDSGVVAAPAAGDLHLDLGATYLSSGDYAVAVWADNVTLATRVASNSGVTSMRLTAEVSGLTGGIPASGTVAWTSSRFLGGVNVEADV